MSITEIAAVQRLCNYPHPYEAGPELESLFIEAMRENIEWHISRSDFYRKLIRFHGFDPSDLKSEADYKKIPWIPAGFFKSNEVLSIGPEEIFQHLTSSGTSGQKSQMFFDRWTLHSAQRMIDFIFELQGWATPDQPVNYLLYSYESEPGSTLGTAYTDHFLCKYAPAHAVFTALRRTGRGAHDFDSFGCIEALKRYAQDGLPVRIFGFPAFLYFTLRKMRELGIPPLSLSKQSLIFLGGGWKGYADQAIQKEDLRQAVTDLLGIPADRIRDGFGSVEHCIPYIECARHQFHVPVWSRVIIRDVRSLQPRRYGEPGFLQFISPYITSVPAQSVLMGDLASLYEGKDCGCGIPTPYFVVHGRAGTSKNKSCAVAAAELLKREK